MADSRTADLEAQLLQGARGVQNNTENMLERLSKMFKAADLVTIKNPFDEAFGWVYTDPGETTVEQPDTVTRRVNFGAAKARTLDVGESRTIPGWEAYIALERMWKMYAQTDPKQVAIVLTSRQEMDSFLDRAFVGIFDANSANSIRQANDALGFDKAKEGEDRSTATLKPAPQQEQVTPPVVDPPAAPVAPTNDPNLGFDDENNDDEQTPPVIPPLQDQTQQSQLPPELQ